MSPETQRAIKQKENRPDYNHIAAQGLPYFTNEEVNIWTAHADAYD
jgi:hypothetical protein